MQIVNIKADKDLEFDEARDLAVDEAARYVHDPMVLSWLNRRTGRHSPDVDCCQEEGKETWEIYAESRGGTVRVEVGDLFVFIFRES